MGSPADKVLFEASYAKSYENLNNQQFVLCNIKGCAKDSKIFADGEYTYT